jgi:hypothetical protein
MFVIRPEHFAAFRAAAGVNAPNAVGEALQEAGIAATVDPVARTVAVSDSPDGPPPGSVRAPVRSGGRVACYAVHNNR